jgi:hypothetical protein
MVPCFGFSKTSLADYILEKFSTFDIFQNKISKPISNQLYRSDTIVYIGEDDWALGEKNRSVRIYRQGDLKGP